MKVKNRYAVLVSGMLIQLCAGIIYMWGVFREPVTKHLNWESSFTSSIMLASFVLGIILGGRLQDVMGPRKVTIVGSVLISCGMVLTAFVSSANPWLIYLTYGFMGGLGVGFVYTCTVSCIQKWFPDKRGFATGMIVSAFGFSLVIFAPLVNYMLSDFGVSLTFTVLGLSFLVLCLLGCIFISNPPLEHMQSSSSKNAPNIRQYSTLEMLKTKQFYLLAFSMLLLLPAYFILNPLLMSLGKERGLTHETALLGVMLTGIASASGRLLLTWISDKIGRKAAMLTIGCITIISVLLMIIAQGTFFLVCLCAIAFAFGSSSGVYAATTADSFGTKNGGLNFGCVMVAFGVSALISPIISNQISSTQNYTNSFILAASTTAVAILLIILLKLPNKKNA